MRWRPGGAEEEFMRAYSLAHGEGDAIWMFDSLDTIKAGADQTDGKLTAVEFLDFQGSSVPLHINDRWDSGFYIVEGEYTFVVGDDLVEASAGAWIFVPRNTAHGWRCQSARGRILNVTTPGGFEAFYRHVGQAVTDRTRLPARTEPDVDLLSGAAAQHGIAIIGPPPGP
jgi:quercetin dioxygenase-like cupin family protein